MRACSRLFLLPLLAGGLAPGLPAVDCNANGSDDTLDLETGASRDCNANTVPDECDLAPGVITFELAKVYEAGEATRAPIIVDLDGDGDADIVAPNRSGDDLSVLLNRGDGDFDLAPRLDVGDYPLHVLAIDLDGDADLDLVAVNSDSDDVSIIQGLGNAAFAPAVSIPVGDSPGRVAGADLDGDADTDLVVTNGQSDDISIARNQGGLAFSVSTQAAGDRPAIPVVADLDDDGDLDVAATCSGDGELPGSIAVLRNLGGGSLAAAVSHGVGLFPRQLLAEDLDGDGRRELIALCTGSREISVLRNTGGGAFALAASWVLAGKGNDLESADMDGDGDTDLLVAGGGDARGLPGKVTLLRNDGNGGFADVQTVEAWGSGSTLDVVDLDGDGDGDVATVAGETLNVLENAGGVLGEARRASLGINGIDYFAAGDLDGDGDLDIAAGSLYGNVSVVINASAQTFQRGCDAYLRGDINVDGRVSISDVLMLHRVLYDEPLELPCWDAADVIDDESLDICDGLAVIDALFETPGWTVPLAAPFPAPGFDPQPHRIPYMYHGCPDIYEGAPLGLPLLPLGCFEYRPTQPPETSELVRLGDAVTVPGGEAKVPIYVSASVPVDAIQLVVEYDPALIEIPASAETLSYEGAFYEQFFGREVTITRCGGGCSKTITYGHAASLSLVNVEPGTGIAAIVIAGHYLFPGFEVPPGNDVLVGWIRARISPAAPPDTVVSLTPTNGPGGAGTGPFRLRNELCSKGEARYVSTLPRLEGARLAIVADQAFFRGDANGDELLNISDPIRTLGTLFLGDRPLDCADAADANDDGRLDLSDAVFLLGFLFQGGVEIPPPWREKGLDPTADTLRCQRLRP